MRERWQAVSGVVVGALMMIGAGPGCGGKGEPGGDKAAGGGAAGEPAMADPKTPKELKLSNGITVTAPGDAKESLMGTLVTVVALGGKCQAMLGEATDMSPSFDNNVSNIERGNRGGPLKEMKRKEKKESGEFVIEWTTDKKFGYASRRMVQGKAWSCDRVSADADGHACVVAVCESMK